MEEKELRSILHKLLEAFGRTRMNLMAHKAILQAISNMTAGERGKLTSTQIHTEIESVRAQLQNQPDELFLWMAAVLHDPTNPDLVEALKKFVSQLQW